MSKCQQSVTSIPTPTADALDRLEGHFSDTYRVIETQVARLNDELAKAHDERLQELTEKERLAGRLQTLLNALPAGVVVVDAEGRIRDCNPAAVDLLGEPLVGEQWLAIIGRVFVRGAAAGPEPALRDGRLVSLYTCPLGAEPGQIVLLQDVTESRRLQGRLEQHRRLVDMGKMAATLAHQIRTPLASALLYASHLRNPELATDKRERFSSKVVESLRGLERLINDMLLFARGEVGEKKPVPVEELLRRATEPFAGTAVRFTYAGDASNAVVHANADMLTSALENVIDNAVRAMGGEGKIEFLIRGAPEEHVEIEIRDHGPGISDELAPRIFEPFVTGSSSGTGLGLAVVRAIVGAHGGEAWVKPRGHDGCSVWVRLPLVHPLAGDHAVPSARLAVG